MRARPLVAAALAVVAVAGTVVAVAPALRRPPAPAEVAASATPVFSLRRVPGAVARRIATDRLRDDLDAVLAATSLGGARDDTCLAVADGAGRPLYSRDAQRPLIPASTMKLLTASVALARLGPDFRYETVVSAAGPPRDGSVDDLWFVGAGDPLLATTDFALTAGWLGMPRPATRLEELADAVWAAGVRRVGRVVGDESRYDTQRYVPTWDPSYAAVPYVGPQSALTVNDGYARYDPVEVPAAAPAANAASLLAGELRVRGISVGAATEGRAPGGAAPLARVSSPPLTEVLAAMLQHSHNLGAELIVKELGVRFGGGGTTAAGLEVVRAGAAGAGVPLAALAAADGSGLDRGDRLSCEMLQAVLRQAPPDGPLARGLPVAGRSGTLVRRFVGTPAEGRVRAKTGSLSGVVGLSGYASGHNGSSVAFSLVANDLPSEGAGAGLQERVASILASYPRAPDPRMLGPRPAPTG